MANRGVKGRIVDETGAGIKDLTVKAVDFDPFFNEDDTLKSGKTDGSGNFELTYSTEDFTFWDPHRNPDIVVQIFGPRYEDPERFGTRLLHETPEAEDVDDEILDVGVIKIHRDNIDGWLVTHTTLNPESATPVALFQGNKIRHLVDGDAMFPAVTDAATAANTSINLMTLFFDVDNNLITKFKSDFNPSSPPTTNCKAAMEATLEEVLLTKAANPAGKLVNVVVTDIPLSANDTVTEVREFFKNTGVNTSAFTKGFAVLHAKAIVVDGVKAILMGSPLKQFYFSDDRHAIRDARHKGSLNHDVNIEVEGPAVAHIDKTFAAVWKSTGEPLTMITPGVIDPKEGENTASVQVLRTLPGHTFKANGPNDEDLPHGETGILEAYERAINNAERYIYIENQYFTSPEIIDALIGRMKDTAKPKLQIILVLNFRPDLPGYPDRQIDNVNQLKIWADANGHRLGVYTMWSRAEIVGSGGQKRFEVMPIYAHSKMAIIDDKWATVGSANLDGTSMNYHEIGLILTGAIADKFIDKIKLEKNVGKFLWEVFWYLFFFILKQMVFNLTTLAAILFIAYKLIFDFKETLEKIRETLGDILDIPELVREAFTRTAPHALPHRSRQPPRSVEMNLVIYNGIAGQPTTAVIKQLRERLWKEHLGLESLPPEMEDVPQDPANMNWVEFWNSRAENYLQMIKNEQSAPAHAPKILRWTAETEAEEYLRALKIRTKGLRNQAEKFDFSKCKFEDKKLLPWPVI
ncbi:MAG: phospholipase D-like domain-containing protein [Candidatus Binatia bacterium]